MRGRGGGYRNTRPQQQRREGADVGTTNWETENTKPDQETATGGGIEFPYPCKEHDKYNYMYMYVHV